MANRHRGEIDAELNGRQWTLCLTLGALAELEGHFKVDDLPKLAERLASGSLSAGDIQAILLAGLRGGGHDIQAEEVAEMRSPTGATGYARIVSDLLVASFGSQSPSDAQ